MTQKLGEGGMGSVYLAEHPTIGKKVALKVLHAEFSSNPEVANRFFTEAKSVNAIGHPNIVDIVDYGVLQAGAAGRDRMVYFIMEYLAGVTLSQVIRAEAPLPPERALTIALQVADALAASHKHGIVHRDLKPDNIILIQRGRERDFVKLLDFGIAKLTSDAQKSHQTRTGLVLGTPAYMSPEQCEGRANVDHRTDVYALGICLYEMLTGRVPFIGEGYGEILVQHLTQNPVPPSQYRMMSPHIEAVVMKALEKRQEMRYPTMDEFIRAMSDPVGFVEAHGGVQSFIATQLMPSSAPLPPPVRMTPAPGYMQTPTGLMSPVPGTLTTPGPTTLSAAAGQQTGGSSKKTGFIIAGVAVVALAGGAIALVASKGHGKTTEQPATQGSDSVVSMNNGSGSAMTVTPPPPVVVDAAVAPPPPVIDAAAAVVKPDVTLLKLTIDSTPQGAEIYLNAVDTGKKTPATLTVPKTDVKANIRLKLHGYVDAMINNVALDSGDEVKEAVTLKVYTVTPPGGGGHTGSGKGSGKTGTGHHDVDGLERPE
ncbi:MAG: serine/threonine protein kinase [Deltaproteobacteria bacterium]|nr:serine/threonine protein kinase [Deltaproteobacteria bacterium]